MRVMALDVGDVRVGVATSDPLRMIASPLEVIDRTKVDLIKRIKEIVKERTVSRIVVGMPISLDGTKKVQAEKVQKFIDELSAEMPEMEIDTIDERMSTVSADRMLKESTKKDAREKRKVVDKIAATIILQNYLDMKKGK